MILPVLLVALLGQALPKTSTDHFREFRSGGAARLSRLGQDSVGGGGASPLLTGLISYYKFDDDTLDATGTYHGTPTSITYVTGKLGNALNGNGATSRVSIPTNVDMYLIGDFTIQAWIKATNWSDYGMIFTKQPYYEMRIEAGGAYMSMLAGSGPLSGGYGGVNGTDFGPPGTPSGVWAHVIGRRSGTSYTVFVNGVLFGTRTDAIQASSPGQAVLIGSRQDGYGSLGTNGFQIDEIGVWNRALTPAEITQLYNAGAALAYPFN